MPAFHISPKWTKLFGLGPGVFAQGGIDWLLRDEFMTAEGPPLASPRTCEPGPGTLTLVQTTGQFSIVGEKVLIAPSSEDDGSTLNAYSSAMARTGGLTVLGTVSYSHNFHRHSPYLGWFTAVPPANTAVEGAISTYQQLIYCFPASGSVSPGVNVDVPCAVILLPVGFVALAKLDGTWQLLWVDKQKTTATLYAGFLGRISSPHTSYVDYLRVRQLPAPFDTDYGLAALDVNPGVSGTAYTAVANAIHDLAVTAPDPLANTCELRYRVLDDNNYWSAYFDATGAFKLDSVSGGVATNRISVAAVATAGNTYTIRVLCDGTKHNCYTLSGTTWTKRGSEVNVSHQDSQTTVKPVAGTGWTLGRLTNWPRTSAAYAELDKV